MAKKPWVGYLTRGCSGVLLCILLVLPNSPLTGRICISLFFIANGLFSLKYDERGDSPKDKREKVPAFISLIGGIILLLFTVSTLILKLFSLSLGDVGGYLFGPISIIIGLFQIQGGVRIMPNLGHRLLAQSSLTLGVIEVLGGIAVLIYGPVDWQVRVIVLIWVAMMALVMLATAYRLRETLEAAQQTQPVSQK